MTRQQRKLATLSSQRKNKKKGLRMILVRVLSNTLIAKPSKGLLEILEGEFPNALLVQRGSQVKVFQHCLWLPGALRMLTNLGEQFCGKRILMMAGKKSSINRHLGGSTLSTLDHMEIPFIHFRPPRALAIKVIRSVGEVGELQGQKGLTLPSLWTCAMPHI